MKTSEIIRAMEETKNDIYHIVESKNAIADSMHWTKHDFSTWVGTFTAHEDDYSIIFQKLPIKFEIPNITQHRNSRKGREHITVQV